MARSSWVRSFARDAEDHGDLHPGIDGLTVLPARAEGPLSDGLYGGGLEITLGRADRGGVADIAPVVDDKGDNDFAGDSSAAHLKGINRLRLETRRRLDVEHVQTEHGGAVRFAAWTGAGCRNGEGRPVDRDTRRRGLGFLSENVDLHRCQELSLSRRCDEWGIVGVVPRIVDRNEIWLIQWWRRKNEFDEVGVGGGLLDFRDGFCEEFRREQESAVKRERKDQADEEVSFRWGEEV